MSIASSPGTNPQQADERDQPRGRRAHVDKAIGDANGEIPHERDKIANHASPIVLRPEHDAARRACRDLAIGVLRLAERAGLRSTRRDNLRRPIEETSFDYARSCGCKDVGQRSLLSC
jgi:hypothetical protein